MIIIRLKEMRKFCVVKQGHPYVFSSNPFPCHVSLSETGFYGGQYHEMDIYLKINKIIK
jgi:hypothetical protein